VGHEANKYKRGEWRNALDGYLTALSVAEIHGVKGGINDELERI
jgi:hypothetical protein